MAANAFSSRIPLQTLHDHRQSTSSVSRGQPALLLSRCLRRCQRNGSLVLAATLNKAIEEDENTPLAPAAWKAVSLSQVAASALFDPAYRAKLEEEYGFTQIAQPLPPNVTVKDLIETIPEEAFKISEWKAWRSLAVSVGVYVTGLCWIAVAPWYLLPFAWMCTTAGVSGLFVIGHDCGHKSFSSNKLVEDTVGTLSLLLLLYPYESWRFKHDHHHAKTNMLHEDTAWHPIMREHYDSCGVFERIRQQLLMGPLRFWGTIYHWMDRHFDPATFRPNEQQRVKRSIALVFLFIATAGPLIICIAGFDGWVKFWLIPWLNFHYGMSTLTSVHHTAPHIHFHDAKTWRNADAQLLGTVNCHYPKLFEFLFHYIMVHIPHHISTKIPSYNLPLANEALRKRWGKHFNETSMSWRLLKTMMTQCHLHDEEKGYVPFDEGREEAPLIWAVRNWMPNWP